MSNLWRVLFADWPAKMRRERKKDDLVIRAACFLNDGSMIEGRVDNVNQLSDHTPDRDLILRAPIERRTPTGERQELDSHAVWVPARNITALAVAYRVPPVSETPDPAGAELPAAIIAGPTPGQPVWQTMPTPANAAGFPVPAEIDAAGYHPPGAVDVHPTAEEDQR